MAPAAPNWFPNPDGGDYEEHGKFFKYRGLLRKIRSQAIPEEAKLRRINLLKEEVFPLWHRCEEVYKKESDELMAVYLKYNGSEGIRNRYSQEYEETKAKISASDDKSFLEDVELYEAYTTAIYPLNMRTFIYGAVGTISYRFKGQNDVSDRDRDRRLAEAELPAINLVPLGTDGGMPHHHNMNPDDDLSLNPTLLQLLHRLMDHKDAESFINFDDEKRGPSYYMRVCKPRWFRFIEQGLTSDPSIGYGATACFNDMLLLFRGPSLFYKPNSEYRFSAQTLELYMRKLLGEMGSVGEQLLALYNAIVEQGMEEWADPELIYFRDPYHPRYPGYDGTKPDLNTIKAAALDQLKRGQQRVQQLRRRLALPDSTTDQTIDIYSFEKSAFLDHKPTKRPREESAGRSEDGRDSGPKRQRTLGSASPGPSNRDAAAPRQPAAKRARRQADDHDDGDDDEAEEGRAAKRQRLTKTAPSTSAPAMSSGAVTSGSHAGPSQQAGRKRTSASTDDDYDENNDGDGDGHGPSGSKRRRLIQDKHPVDLHAASPGAAQAHPDESNPEPANLAGRPSQGCTSSLAQQPASQQSQFPTHYEAPSSQPLNFSRNTITMGKVTKMSKSRPWLFGYNTEEGYGIYAFVKCPGQNCRHRFSSHPLRDHRARDHILSCNQPILDEQDMVRQYACQVVKDAGRKSDLTVDWARKSNINLLPSDQKDNHPDNFPLSPAAE